MIKMKSIAVVALVALTTSVVARAETITLNAGTNPAVPSSFTLDFGGFGRSTGHISFMDIELEIDADSGVAQFARYYQEVDPLTLPGGISTGNIIIEILAGSSSGTYNELTGLVDTLDTYLIHFDGPDLLQFLTSPFELESSSQGALAVSAVDGGTFTLDWAGAGDLELGPGNVLAYEYTCETNASFDANALAVVRLGLIPSVLNLQIPVTSENRLIRDLDYALTNLDRGYDSVAAYWLRRFANDVDAMSPNPIPTNTADRMIDEARTLSSELGGVLPKAGSR